MHRIVIEINKSINEEHMKNKLLEKSRCKGIAIRLLSRFTQYKTYQYSILGYGFRDAIAALKDILILDITNIGDDDPKKGHIAKVQHLTNAVLQLIQPRQQGINNGGNCRR